MNHARLCTTLVVVLSATAASAAASEPAPRYRLAYCTFFGGSRGEQAREVIVYPDGSVLVGGQTNSSDLPTTPGAVQPEYGGEEPPAGHPGMAGGDCFLLKLSPDGGTIAAATYFGGSRQERNVYGMALDRQGDVVITSATRSPDLPTTDGCFQPRYGGPPSDWMVAKLSADLKSLRWCTYVGGQKDDFPRGGLTLDGDDNVYIVGGTESPDFPTTPGVFQAQRKGGRDAAIVKLSADGARLLAGTRLGGSDWDGLMGVNVDNSGNVFVAGHTRSRDFPGVDAGPQPNAGGDSDCYLAKLSPGMERLVWATYLGGSKNEFAEHKPFLAEDGTVLLTGVTSSADFPTTPGAFQRQARGDSNGFLTRLSADGRRLEFSTLLGGSAGEFLLMPTPNAGGDVFLVGTTRSADFPVTADAVQTTFAGANHKWDGDGVLVLVSGNGSRLQYATFLGGRGGDLVRTVALGPDGAIYLAGSTSSPDFPVTPAAAQTTLHGPSDAFIAKLVPVE